MANEVVVKSSKIHGKGVFAAKEFKKGEVVLEWKDSKPISPDELKKLPEKEKKYVSKVEDVLVWFKEPEKFVNHSCTPNTKAKIGKDVAIRNIAPGEEITADYFKETEELDFKCNCKEKDCVENFMKDK